MAPFFFPLYERHNDTIVAWSKELGLALVDFTPGTYSNADWTHPELGKQYLSSYTIYSRVLEFEHTKPNGLSGFILLTHIGTDPRRTDKFYLSPDDSTGELIVRGYRFTLLGDSIQRIPTND